MAPATRALGSDQLFSLSSYIHENRVLTYVRAELPAVRDDRAYVGAVAYYIFNVVSPDAESRPTAREQAIESLRVRMWGIDADEPHRSALAPGDLVLVYLGAPERMFIGRTKLASAAHEWTPAEAQAYPGDSRSGVLLAHVEEWDPPVPMSTVLAQIDPAENAKADFEVGVVRITATEYATALAVGGGRFKN